MDMQLTRRFHFMLLLGLFLFGVACHASETQAQVPEDSVIADTLDWHRYYPLEVGNIWEYQVYEVESLMRREILGDTLAAGRTYFIMEETWQGGTILPRQIFFVRYDTIGTVVSLRGIEADTTTYPRAFPVEPVIDAEFLEYFDLRTAFGDTLYIDTERFGAYWVGGGYEQSLQVSSTTVQVAGLKCLYLPDWYDCYATDIGYTGGGGGPFFYLRYAKIGGREYGTSLATALDPDPVNRESFIIESVYPSPFKGETRVVYELAHSQRATVVIFNGLGQKMREDQMGVQPAGRHEYLLRAKGLAAGLYFVEIMTEQDGKDVQPVLVVR